MNLRTIRDYNWHNQTVLTRVDYNVPLVKKRGQLTVADPRRIRASYDTINALLRGKNKIVLLSHLGRPAPDDFKRFSLEPVLHFLQKDTTWNLHFLTDPFAPEAKNTIDLLPPKTVILVENLRFAPGEKKNSPAFAQALSQLGTAYVNDAFSASHRSHASITGLPPRPPAAAGYFFLTPLTALSKIISTPRRPLIIIVGGAKISDKVDSIVNLAQIADAILLGGGVANNFFKAVGLSIQRSYLQDAPADLAKTGLSYVDIAQDILSDNLSERLLKDGYIPLPKIIYPIDVVAATGPKAKKTQIIKLTSDQVHPAKNLMYLDIGPKTIKLYQELIAQAGAVFWNGPMGYSEEPLFAAGTRAIARAAAKSKAYTLLGGGDTLAAAQRFNALRGINYLSLAGGATLEFLANRPLPGLEILRK